MKGQNTATGDTGMPTDFISFHAKGQPNKKLSDFVWHDHDDVQGSDAAVSQKNLGLPIANGKA